MTSHYDDAIEADRSGNSRASRRLLETAVSSGDDRARIALAAMLLDGRGGPLDINTAIQVLEPLEAGSDPARRMLATAISLGPGGFPAAVRKRLEHARGGDRDASVQLGVLLFDTHPLLSFGLLQDAARQGAGLAAAALLHHAGKHEGLWPELVRWLNALRTTGYPLAAPLKTAMTAIPQTDHPPQLPADPSGFDTLNPTGKMDQPDSTRLNESPSIWSRSAMISEASCDYLLAAVWPALRRAEVFDPATGRTSLDAHRKAYSASIPRSLQDLVMAHIVARMAACAGTKATFGENLAVLLYYPGDEYKAHLDCLTSDEGYAAAELASQGQRRATALAALNSGYEGGETVFPRVNLHWRGQKGDVLSFQNVTGDGAPDPMSLHQGMPVISGWKALASLWVRETMPGEQGIAERPA